MKLYDIRNALKNLVHINKDLTKDRLTTLLHAAAWDEQDINDAILLWETNSFKDADTGSTTAEITLKKDMLPTKEILDTTTTIFTETTLSKELIQEKQVQKSFSINEESSKNQVETKLSETATEKEEIKEEIEAKEIKEVERSVSTEYTPVFSQLEKTEIVLDKTEKSTPPSTFDYVSKQTPHEELPHNLPLRPYESSYVTVPLNEYEKRFASHTYSRVDTMPIHTNVSDELVKEEVTPIIQNILIPQYQKEVPLQINKVLEAPLETEDKYLTFIAVVLFIFIMFILGYMHINGRI